MEKRTGENWQDSRRAVCQGVVEYWLPYGFFLQLLVAILDSTLLPFISNLPPPTAKIWISRQESDIIITESLGGEDLNVTVKIDPEVKDTQVLITVEKRSRFLCRLVDVIEDFDKKPTASLTGYIGDKAYLIDVADILRIYAANQKVYVQTAKAEYLLRHRLYELEELLDRQRFLRISNSEIIHVRKIQDIDLSVTGRICIRFREDVYTYVSRRYIPKIKKSLGI